jgi:DNA adenine methylase
MKYMGSKARHANEILTVIQEHLGYPNTYDIWVEPFVGGANMICEVKGAKRRIGNDQNQYVIRMFQALQKGWIPPDEISEERYQQLKRNSKNFIEDEAAIRGFVGVGCSYSGKWFGGYARGNDNKGNPRNYCLESRNNVLNQVPKIANVEFFGGDYKSFPIPEHSIIYCDPPYQDTTKYNTDFNHKEFWEWCNEQINKGHKVFVSEYNAPDDWECIWSKQVNNSLTKETGSKKGIEKLFTKSTTPLSDNKE